jgi:predicted AAA+ superfamily ATPase
MLSEKDLRDIIALQREWILHIDKGIIREELNNITLTSQFAIIIQGVRRCGKSTLLSQLLSKQKRWYYLNLEDPRLEGFTLDDFIRVEKIFKEIYGENGVYFFDEIQNIGKWENYVRNLIDRKNKVVITGSNASLLSKELGTKLTGRHMGMHLFPFSYSEFLQLCKLSPSSSSFEKFLSQGGFPGYLKADNPIILNELLNDIIMRDIVNRFGIRNSSLLKKMAVYLISHVGKEFSFNSLKKMFQIKSVQTVVDYISYFENSYILFIVPKFSYSYKQQQIAAKKVYSIDNGLSHINSVSFSKDKGRMLENIIFLHLRKKFPEVFYFKEKGECDFVVKEKQKIVRAIQVCYVLTEENKEREVNGLIEAMTKFNLKEGLLLTLNQKDEFRLNGKKILVKPAWEWLKKQKS